MSATKYAEAGMAAVQARKWDEAITNLTKAIDQSKSPQWLLSRSQAYMEGRDFPRALRDAELAYCTAAERGNDKSRKQMIEAQHRRSVIYFRRKEFANADACASWSQQLAKGVAVRAADKTAEYIDEQGFYHITAADIQTKQAKGKEQQGEGDSGTFGQMMSLLGGGDESKTPYDKDWKKAQAWRETVIRFLEALPADDPARKVTVRLVPTKPSLDDKDIEEQKPDPEIEAAKAPAAQAQPSTKSAPASGPFRNSMYQSDSSITVSLFMKFASKEDTANVQVDLQPNLITITGVPREPSTSYIVPHAAVDPAKSTYRVAPMKVEIALAKAVPGKWPSFGREELAKPDPSSLPQADGAASAKAATATTTATDHQENSNKATAPTYPTSAKGGPKNWDRLTMDDDDDKDAAGVDDFFKNLFKGATPDQQRAMMKSYQESNGTTLSTDWESVSQGTVPTNPPEGVEAKKW